MTDETLAAPAGPAATAAPGGSVVRQGVVVAIALTTANILSYGVSAVASRRLGPAEFGVFAAMLSLVIVGVVVSLGLQTVVTRALSGRAEAPLSALAGTALAASVATGAVVAAAAWPLAAFLHLASPAAVLWTAATLVPLTWAGFVQGAAQGRERFGILALVVLAVSTGKVMGGLVGLAVSRSASTTMALTAAGTLVGAVVATALARHLLVRPAMHGWRVAEVAMAAHALFALFVLSNTDLLLARHFLPPVAAGLYGAGAVIAKVAFWLPQFVSVVALPRLVDTRRHQAAVRTSVLVLAVIGVAVTLITAAAATLVVKAVGGSAYTDLAPHAWQFAAAGSALVMAQLLLYARLARGDHRATAVVWSAVAVQVGVVATVAHGSVAAIINTTLVVVLLLVGVGLLAERSTRHGQTAPATS